MKLFSNISRIFGNRPPRREALSLARLELHVTHACNLACESCSHYSDQGHAGNLDLAHADRWMAAWSNRFAVEEFVLLGGVPTIHPRLSDFVVLARRHWPMAR